VRRESDDEFPFRVCAQLAVHALDLGFVVRTDHNLPAFRRRSIADLILWQDCDDRADTGVCQDVCLNQIVGGEIKSGVARVCESELVLSNSKTNPMSCVSFSGVGTVFTLRIQIRNLSDVYGDRTSMGFPLNCSAFMEFSLSIWCELLCEWILYRVYKIRYCVRCDINVIAHQPYGGVASAAQQSTNRTRFSAVIYG